jgi:hypothetical protein
MENGDKKMKMREIVEGLKTMGYYAEISDYGYINVYGKMLIDNKGNRYYGDIEYDCVEYLKLYKYQFYKTVSGNPSAMHHIVFFNKSKVAKNETDNR